jgi:hypothetical protein
VNCGRTLGQRECLRASRRLSHISTQPQTSSKKPPAAVIIQCVKKFNRINRLSP